MLTNIVISIIILVEFTYTSSPCNQKTPSTLIIVCLDNGLAHIRCSCHLIKIIRTKRFCVKDMSVSLCHIAYSYIRQHCLCFLPQNIQHMICSLERNRWHHFNSC